MCEKRLEKIEKDKAMSNDDVVIKEDDYNWLIEQVEQNEQRNKKLSEVHSYLQEVNLVDDDVSYWGKNVIDVLLSYSKELEEQNKHYREALEFYADTNNYESEPNDISTVEFDSGIRARKALKDD